MITCCQIRHSPFSGRSSGSAEGVCNGGTQEPGRKQCSITASPASLLICTASQQQRNASPKSLSIQKCCRHCLCLVAHLQGCHCKRTLICSSASNDLVRVVCCPPAAADKTARQYLAAFTGPCLLTVDLPMVVLVCR